MCYAFKTVFGKDGKLFKVSHRDFYRLEKEGKIQTKPDGYFYAKDTIPVISNIGNGIELIPMRWDLIPSYFMQSSDDSLSDVIKKKNSSAKNPETGKSWGFSSFNARIESISQLPSFRKAWHSNQRCIIPVKAFKERPNMDDAPKELKNKEYEILLENTAYFAGIYDKWISKKDEVLYSCTVITKSSKGIKELEEIWHERIPVLFDETQCDDWLSEKTNEEEAKQICANSQRKQMQVVEIIKQNKKTEENDELLLL